MAQAGRWGATAVGGVAIALWSGLALLTVAAHGIPPFELLALSFGTAFVAGMAVLAVRGRPALARLRQPLAPWLLAFFALFFYHALYFYALATIAPARASLLNYLWPLLIVVFSSLSPTGGGFSPRHLLGTALGLLGAGLLFVGRGLGSDPGARHLLGYAAALACAVVWSGYSVLNRRFAGVPGEMLIGVCAAVSLAGAAAHFLFEPTVPPAGGQWGAILLIGVGPTGLAFLAWDYATKYGSLLLLGVLSYLTPLASTLLLAAAGRAPASVPLALAALLIVGGAALACWHPPPG